MPFEKRGLYYMKNVSHQKIRYDLLQNETKRQSEIRSNTCPNCKGKLKRGNRNKDLDYKRVWTCRNVECGAFHTI